MGTEQPAFSFLEQREYQRYAVEFILAALNKSGSAIIEAPTGSGKTIMGLVSAIRARNPGDRILYLTRTNSQQQQVINELRLIRKDLKINAVPFQGRGNLCLLYGEVEDREEASPESLSRFCSSRKKRVMEGDSGACRFFNSSVRSDDTMSYIFDDLPAAEDIKDFGSVNTICPYEAIKASLPRADVVIAPYAQFINLAIGERFLSHWGVTRDRLVIILDEAHNLPEIARSVASFEISSEEINRAEKEALEFGDDELVRRIRVTDYMEILRNAIASLKRDFLHGNDEARISFTNFVEYVMVGGHMNSSMFQELNRYLGVFGEKILNMKEEDRKIPRSYVYSLSTRLNLWEQVDEAIYLSLVSDRRGGTIEASCMDPSLVLAPLKQSRTIHLSGTLEPIDAYRRMTGFDEAPFHKAPNVFPAGNRLSIFWDQVTTKYDEFDEEKLEKIVTVISELVEKTGRKSIVFFPSYQSLNRAFAYSYPFEVLREQKGMGQSALMEKVEEFRIGDSVLFAVSGGRISEGMNFPGRELELVIIAGVPYPRPDVRNRALMEYYDRFYGKGWEYSVTFPALVKMRQEIGRLIRSEGDIGASVILDKRASYFMGYMPDLKLSQDPVGDVVRFFGSKEHAAAHR
jgi:DNA excision repair protein ERCC-2